MVDRKSESTRDYRILNNEIIDQYKQILPNALWVVNRNSANLVYRYDFERLWNSLSDRRVGDPWVYKS